MILSNKEYRDIYVRWNRLDLDLVAPMEREFFKKDAFKDERCGHDAQLFYDVMSLAGEAVDKIQAFAGFLDETPAGADTTLDAVREGAIQAVVDEVTSIWTRERGHVFTNARMPEITTLLRWLVDKTRQRRFVRNILQNELDKPLARAVDAAIEGYARNYPDPSWCGHLHTDSAWRRVRVAVLYAIPRLTDVPDAIIRNAVRDAVHQEVRRAEAERERG